MIKTAFITGASSGIGLELAREMARRGYRVALSARRADMLRDAVLDLKGKGHEALAVACDVTDAAAVRRCVGEVEAAWGGIDVAVANAGIGFPTRATKFVLADAESIMKTNFGGMLNLFDAVIPGMLARKRGRFVGIASLAGLRGMPSSSMYSASKAAMQAFLEASRIDLADHGIGVTTVNPGWIKTPMTEKNKFPMPFLLEVDDAARIIARGIERGAREVEFPLPMSLLVRFARLLPNAIYDRVMRPYAGRKIDDDAARR